VGRTFEKAPRGIVGAVFHVILIMPFISVSLDVCNTLHTLNIIGVIDDSGTLQQSECHSLTVLFRYIIRNSKML